MINIHFIRAQKKAGVNESSNMTTLVVGNPLLPNYLNEQLNLNELPHTEQEASMVAEMLQTKPLIKAQVNLTNECYNNLLIKHLILGE